MFRNIIRFSLDNKLLIVVGTLAIIGWGIYNLAHLPLDAVPDITDNQVQIITSSPDLSAQEVERFVTYPIEIEMGNIPKVEQIRSISRFGLSVITIVFEENADIYWAREQINQKIQKAKTNIPAGYGNPEMGPISTGLGEIYQYVIYPDDGYEEKYDAVELRSIQDWLIKRQLTGLKGVVEVNSSGGYLKQYEVALDQNRMKAFGITVHEIFDAVESGNANSGGSYIEKENQTYFIRGEGLATSLSDLENIVVRASGVAPILLKNVATVKIGHAPRFGAVTMNGKGEVVAGQVMMLKGENSMEVTKRVKQRIEEIKTTLPEGIILEPYLDRAKLVNQTTRTVVKNLTEGALIVIFILVLLLGNFRAGLIVASVIPISMLFAVSCMRIFGVSANLMSLGAIDFGLIVDGAVIVVEAILHHLGVKNRTMDLTPSQKSYEVYESASRIRTSAAFGEIIILMVYLPIFFLRGVEGKMFIPMAQTVSFAILGALILSSTYVPMMADLFLKNAVARKNTLSDRIMNFIYRAYEPVRNLAFQFRYLVLLSVFLLFLFSLFILSRMGSEFIPTLEEGDLALHQILPPGSSIRKGVDVSAKLQDILTGKFPEVEKVVTKIGTAEIPTDIMPLEAGDIYVIMKPKSEWTTATSREEMFDKMEMELNKFPGISYEFTQPIQMRFNELMTGVRQDIAIKIYGEDLGVLLDRAHAAEAILRTLPGIGDIKVEATAGLQQMVVDYELEKMATYGVSVAQLNDILKASFAGKFAGYFYEGERRFDVVIRLREEERQDISSLRNLLVDLPNGMHVPMSELAHIDFAEGPTQISRDDTKRRITIGVNARNIDIATLVSSIEESLTQRLDLPPGYYIRYGGQFENLQRAQQTLGVVVPIALGIILLLLYLTFNSIKYALLIFVAIPLSAIGGIWALYLRAMPFSISAGVGFIALFGVAVLNGIVLVGYFNQLKREGMTDILQIVKQGTKVRLRPVVMTAAVASLGFLPMALSRSAGAEVQQPLATVVIGGLITATFLTLIILPILYYLLEKRKSRLNTTLTTIVFLTVCFGADAQPASNYDDFLSDIRSSQMHLGQFATLQKEALSQKAKNPLAPNLTYFSLSTEEYNFMDDVGIQSLNVQQFYRLNKPGEAYRSLYQTQMLDVDNEVAIMRRNQESKVMETFINASHLNSLLQVQYELQNALTEYLRIADRRAELGESSGLTTRQIRQLTMQSGIEVDRLLEQKKILINSLSEWSGKDQLEVVDLDELNMDVPVYTATDQPDLQRLQLDQLLIQNQKDVLLAQNKPQLFTGLRLQRVGGSFLFFGLEAGISIPFNKSYKESQVQASDLAASAKNEQLLWLTELIDIDRRRKMQEALNARDAAERLSVQINEQRTLMDDILKGFRLGEIPYSDLVLAYQNYNVLQQSHLDKLRNYYLNLNELIHYVYQ
ncbi:MAG: CusA/CzcA family heavy metal efflux RND transporter [Saprospiraceae bacterium]|nr:CusA/CzcA family heavy metal efflux RND transporter [Saprospiraceae bacterium]